MNLNTPGSKVLLPIDPYLNEIAEKLFSSPTHSLVLTATPGSGKTTRIPPALLKKIQAQKTHGAIWVLQPRRIAARSAATRVAQEMGTSVGGETVGYQVRFEKRCTDKTKIVYLTEGTLSRILVSNPYLEGVEILILDEFHERSIHTDLALAMALQIQTTVRPDLKILVMSATLLAKPLATFLGGAKILDIPGNIFPIETQFEPQPLGRLSPFALADKLASRVIAFSNNSAVKDILVFLPGKKEIEILKEVLLEARGARKIETLHGQLDLESQAQVLAPQTASSPLRIILSTNVAETSLTVDRVNCVIDSGLSRILETDFDLGIESLRLKQIPKFSATQRTGRAGRQGAGFCHRLWTRDEDLHLEESSQPEILRVDLAPTLLTLAQFGVRDFSAFPFFETPPAQRIRQATQLLGELGLLKDQKLTRAGHEVVESALDFRLASALSFGKDSIEASPTEIIESILEISDYSPLEKRNLQNTLSIETSKTKKVLFRPADRQALVSGLALRGFPDRVGKCRDLICQNGIMVGGRGLEFSDEAKNSLAEFSRREGYPCFFIAPYPFETRKDGKKIAKVEKVFPVKKSDLVLLGADAIHNNTEFSWNSKKLQIEGKYFQAYHDLPLGSAHPTSDSVSETHDWQQALEIFLKFTVKDLPRFLTETHVAFASLVLRFYFLEPLKILPTGNFKLWEPLVFERAVREYFEFSNTKKLSLLSWAEFPFTDFIEFLVPWDLKILLQKEAPERIEVPSGMSHAIVYGGLGSTDIAPKLSVRLQEVFGWQKSPAIGGGKIPLVLELLSPGYKPIQTTRDLASFWKGVYQQIRGELRAQYPKHSWPDDPLNAVAVAKGRRRV